MLRARGKTSNFGRVITKFLAALCLRLFRLATSPVEAGFRMPESLVRNACAFYGDHRSALSSGLPHDAETAQQLFDSGLQRAWLSTTSLPYDFLMQATPRKIGAVSIAIIRNQFDKTYIATAIENNGHKVSINLIVVDGLKGWVIVGVGSSARFIADVSGTASEPISPASGVIVKVERR